MTPLSELFSLKGRAAVVTGGAKGIGLGIAKRLVEAGANVLVTDIDEGGAAATAEIGASFERSDASLASEAQRVVDLCVSRYGHVDVLVNNAGIFPISPALDTTEATWQRVMKLNLEGAFFHAQAAARAMVNAKRSGAIVNIASIDAYHPTGGLVHYDASKAGLVMMTRSLAAELGRHGVRVNGVAPGAIGTPGADVAMETFSRAAGATAEQVRAGFVSRIPLGRMGTPDDIATATVFLASDAASYVTGQTLIVDGGFLVA